MDDRILAYLEDRDEIWHIGDFGDYQVIEQLEALAPLRGVYGNIDGQDVRQTFPEHERFQQAGMDIWMTHIGGYPGKYERHIRDPIRQNPPDLFLSGHSHILKVVRDKKLNLMHLNPGAAGKTGFHKERTLLLMEIKNRQITDLQVVELGRRGKKAASR
jgi:phosphoesterase, MJ0936 family